MKTKKHKRTSKYNRFIKAGGHTPEEKETKQSSPTKTCKGLTEEQCNLQSNCQYIKGTTKRRGYCRRRATPTAKRNTTKKKAKVSLKASPKDDTKSSPKDDTKSSPKDDIKSSPKGNITASIVFPDGQEIELTGIHATATVLQIKHRISQETQHPVKKLMLFNLEDKRDDNKDLQFHNNMTISEIAATGSSVPDNLKLAVVIGDGINLVHWLSQFPEGDPGTITISDPITPSDRKLTKKQLAITIEGCFSVATIPNHPELLVVCLTSLNQLRVYNIYTNKILCYINNPTEKKSGKKNKLYHPRNVLVTADGEYVIVAEPFYYCSIKWYKLTISNNSKHVTLELTKSIKPVTRDNPLCNPTNMCLKTFEDRQTLFVLEFNMSLISEWTMEGKLVRYINTNKLLQKRIGTNISDELINHIVKWNRNNEIEDILNRDRIIHIARTLGKPTEIIVLPKSGNLAVAIKTLGIVIIDYTTLKLIKIISISYDISGIAADSEDNIITRLWVPPSTQKPDKIRIYNINGKLIHERDDFPFLLHKPQDNGILTIHLMEENGGQLVFPNDDHIVIYKSQ